MLIWDKGSYINAPFPPKIGALIRAWVANRAGRLFNVIDQTYFFNIKSTVTVYLLNQF